MLTGGGSLFAYIFFAIFYKFLLICSGLIILVQLLYIYFAIKVGGM